MDYAYTTNVTRHVGSADGGVWDRPTAQDLLQEALIFRGWGIICLPVRGDKKAAVGWKGLQSRKPSDRKICQLFDRAGTRLAGLAALHGRASGGRGHIHAVRDFDTLGASAASRGRRGAAADAGRVGGVAGGVPVLHAAAAQPPPGRGPLPVAVRPAAGGLGLPRRPPGRHRIPRGSVGGRDSRTTAADTPQTRPPDSPITT